MNAADDKPETSEPSPGTEPFVPDFDTGARPVPVSSEFDAGEPSVPFVPIFDTGAQSVPLSSEFDAGEPSVPFIPNFDTGVQSVPVSSEFDTGEPSVPFIPNFDTDSQSFAPLMGFKAQPAEKSEPESKERKSPPEIPLPAPQFDSAAEAPGPVTVPGRYLYLKWWKFVLVLLGTWFFAAVFGLSLFYWWYHTIDKTPAVFTVFVYIVACTVGGLILAMVESKPLIAALAIAVMSSPFASVCAAAPLYGNFYCERVTTPCLMGVLPY